MGGRPPTSGQTARPDGQKPKAERAESGDGVLPEGAVSPLPTS